VQCTIVALAHYDVEERGKVCSVERSRGEDTRGCEVHHVLQTLGRVNDSEGASANEDACLMHMCICAGRA